MGLFVGMSVMSAVEVVVWMIQLAFKLLRGNRAKLKK